MEALTLYLIIFIHGFVILLNPPPPLNIQLYTLLFQRSLKRTMPLPPMPNSSRTAQSPQILSAFPPEVGFLVFRRPFLLPLPCLFVELISVVPILGQGICTIFLQQQFLIRIRDFDVYALECGLAEGKDLGVEVGVVSLTYSNVSSSKASGSDSWAEGWVLE